MILEPGVSYGINPNAICTCTNPSPHQSNVTTELDESIKKIVRGLQIEHYDLLHKYGYADFKLKEEPVEGYEEEAKRLTSVYEQAIQAVIDTKEKTAQLGILGALEQWDGDNLKTAQFIRVLRAEIEEKGTK